MSQTPASLVIWIPLPPRALNPNAKPHWSTKAAAVKDYRYACKIQALNAARADGLEGPLPPPVRVDIVASWLTKRDRDIDNFIASLKSCIDGLVDAGVLAGDSAALLTWGELSIDNKTTTPGATLTLTGTGD